MVKTGYGLDPDTWGSGLFASGDDSDEDSDLDSDEDSDLDDSEGLDFGDNEGEGGG